MDLILMHGLPGSGKSTLSAKLCQQEEMLHLSSDLTRMEFFGDKSCQAYRYDMSITTAIFEIIQLRAQIALKTRKSVVIDAVHLFRPGRKRFSELAKSEGATPVFIDLVVSPEELIRRVSNRTNDPYGSEAGLSVLESFLSRNPILPWEESGRELLEDGFSYLAWDGEKNTILGSLGNWNPENLQRLTTVLSRT